MRIPSTIIVTMVLAASLSAQEAFELSYPGHRIQVVGGMKGTRDASLTPFISGTLDRLPKKQERSRFGLLYRDHGSHNSAEAVLEVTDAGTGKVLREIGVDEWFGKGPLTWQRVPERTAQSPDRFVSVFRQGTNGVIVTRTIERIRDAGFPDGNVLRMTIDVTSPTTANVRARIVAKAEGSVVVDGGNLTIVSSTEGVSLNPAIVMSWGPSASITAAPAESGGSRAVVITGGPVDVPSSVPTTVLRTSIAGTTVPAAQHVQVQASELLAYMRGAPARPQLVLLQSSSAERASPGDTVAYTLNYHNIGTAPAGDVRLSNPIVAGTRYLEGTATGEGADITVERSSAQPPAQGAAVKLTWTFNGIIAPGEGRAASFKVIVR